MSIESKGPVNPIFRVKFRTEMFDFECMQGLAVALLEPRDVTGTLHRHAIAVRYDSTPAEIAHRLRELADWIEEKSK